METDKAVSSNRFFAAFGLCRSAYLDATTRDDYYARQCHARPRY